ncbi:hypothetical protein RND81_12G170600 [Saponaria officinalis]|uniref:MYB transcription factor n=1 Tax=Saponaria officinalis TaxID=3572 RepID=A0AAW1HBS4_SAPOF
MNETIVKWVIEFLLRQQIDDKVINALISSLPRINDDYRLKKTMLLRRIEIETSSGCISENILELIEIIEALDHEKCKNASNLMKDAYCLVAVDCTVRFLVENVEENAKYLEMVDNVWRNRVCKSDGLVSESSKRWFLDIEAAVENSDAYEKIWMRNTRNEALKAVKQYLKEEWECLGPSFLELVAAKSRNEMNELCSGSDGGAGVVCSGNPCRELVVVEGTEDMASIRQKHIAVKGRSHRDAKFLDADEDATKKAGNVATEMVKPKYATPKVGRLKKKTRSNTGELASQVDSLSGDVQTTQMSSFTGLNNGVVEADKMGLKILESRNVARVQRALRNRAKELHAAVSDPLPEALQTAQTLVSLIANLETETQNQTISDFTTIPEADRLQKARKIENPSSGSPSRPRLLSPKALKSCSPLQIPEYRNLQRRRERKRWAPSEEDTLREGVEKYGRGSWKAILTDAKFGEVFQGRTEIDLKDKWRNMTRNSS